MWLTPTTMSSVVAYTPQQANRLYGNRATKMIVLSNW
jgi:hypothetical protein